MAISPKDRYPSQIDTSDGDYPEGKAQNIVSPGDGTGTPWEKDLVNDLFGFQQALLDAASDTPSGDPDKVGASQYLDAVRAVATEEASDVVDARFDADDYVILSPAVAVAKAVSIASGDDEDSGAGFNRTDPHVVESAENNARWVWDINNIVPYHATLTRIDAIVHPGAARTLTNRMAIILRHASWGSVGAPSLTVTDLETGYGTAGTQPATFHHVQHTLGTPVDMEDIIGALQVIVQCGNNAGSSVDRIYGIRLYFTTPRIAPI